MNLFYLKLCKERAQLEKKFSRKLVDYLFAKSYDVYLKPDGNIARWQNALQQLNLTPTLSSELKYIAPYLHIDLKVSTKALKTLIPWRKGPFSFTNTTLDSEWNGSMKWQRITSAIDIKGKTILDVGAGNGYFSHLFSLFGAQSVVGLEPYILFNAQFFAIKQLYNNTSTHLFPLRLDDIVDTQDNVFKEFDIVVSMGVLYHHKSPIQHLQQLKNMLKDGGTLLLETLYVTGNEGYSLTPERRYAHMRNVWFIPSIPTLISWLKRLGGKNIEITDKSITTLKEQRSTLWLGDNPKSLSDFLDGEQTIEGYERNKRVMLTCKF